MSTITRAFKLQRAEHVSQPWSTRKIALVVCLIFHLCSLFMFRKVIPFIPQIMNGDSVINGDELVPFFNWNSQLLDQAAGKFNEITNGFEFRVRYAFLTTWVRYYKVLPFAIIFLIPQIFWWAYLVVAWLLSTIMPQFKSTSVYKITGGAVCIVFMIMIYGKITHFYTLILGFSLFLVAAMNMLYGLAFKQKNPYKHFFIACVITVFNPAVHYLVLFGLYMALTVVTLLVIELGAVARAGHWRYIFRPRTWLAGLRYLKANRRDLLVNNGFWRCIGACVMLIVVTLIPYALMVKLIFLRGVPNLSETVPADYYFIKDASIPIEHVLAFDLAGIMDKELTGDYLAKEPRVQNFAYSILLFVPLLYKPARRKIFNSPYLQRFAAVMYTNTIFSMWATLGYTGAEGVPTFHRTIAFVSNLANGTQTGIGDLVVTLMSTITLVLRFPHRFRLIMLMLSCVLLPMGFVWLENEVAERWRNYRAKRNQQGQTRWQGRLPLIVALVSLLPVLSVPEYTMVYTSGDFNHFLRPYPLAPLRQLKQVLLGLPRGKTVVFPPTETAKANMDIDGYEHKFIDKFHAYYLDLPSYYYGLTGDSNNKHHFFLLLRAMYYEQPWWINIARDLEIKYIVINKELEANPVGGQEYLREVERVILPEMDRRKDYVRKLFENESYVLYEFTDLPTAERVPLLIETDWPTYIQILSRNLDLTRHYDLRHTMMLGELEEFDNLTLVTNDEHMAALDLFIKKNEKLYFKPSSNIMAFNPNLISSAYYLSPMFRLFQFFSDSKWNRLNMITPGLWGTLNGGFIGVPKQTQFRIDLNLPESGTYHLMMRGVASSNEMLMSSKALTESKWINLRARPERLAFYDKAKVFTANRTPLDIDQFTNAELGEMIPSDVVVINSQYDYFDLGTVTADKGKYPIYFDKNDSNPLLVEGIVAVPEETYQTLSLPDNVHVVTEKQLCCRAFVRDGEMP